MATLIAIETVALVLLALLVAGLLRSHAEILRRLAVLDREDRRTAGQDELPDWLPHPREDSAPASDIVGTTLAGDSAHIGVEGSRVNTLIAFLSSGCATCFRFWEALRSEDHRGIPGGGRVVVVTKDSSHESPSKLRELAPGGVPVVMSTLAWEAHRVPVAPYFIYVDGRSGEIVGEGSASTWEQLLSLLRDAMADAEMANGNGRRAESDDRHTGATTTRERLSRADAELAAAGIGPGHPSLYVADPDDEDGWRG
jgi:hypothetical protein